MKRLLFRFAVFLLPFVLLFAFFFVFEPYDYFVLRGDATYGSMPLSSMRKVMLEQPERIILGDSRMANLNTDYIEEITGKPYTMLGFGGASLGECIELFWFAAEHTTMTECVFGVDFYVSGNTAGSEQGRIPAIRERVYHLSDFVFHINYWLEAINTAKYKTVNLIARQLDKPEWISYPEDPTRFEPLPIPQERGAVYRQDLENYAAIINNNLPGDYSITEETYAALLEIAAYCEQNDIELIFVFPPMHESIFELVVEPRGLSDDIEQLKATLREHATV